MSDISKIYYGVGLSLQSAAPQRVSVPRLAKTVCVIYDVESRDYHGTPAVPRTAVLD